MAQAEVTLAELDLEIAGIRSIQVNSSASNPSPVRNLERSSGISFSSEVSTPVVGGLRTVSADVTLTVDY